ncbi:MAG: hypothetical protein K9N11_08000, partial [Lentisphaeria bacterium]|nr:hypothetical protein [Lentisphaeria bacterium]
MLICQVWFGIKLHELEQQGTTNAQKDQSHHQYSGQSVSARVVGNNCRQSKQQGQIPIALQFDIQGQNDKSHDSNQVKR